MSRKLAVALSAPLLALSACATEAHDVPLGAGSTEGTSAAVTLAALHDAPEAAAQAGSARFEMTITMATPGGSIDIVSSGGYDGDRMAMSMDFGSALAGLVEGTDDTVPAVLAEPSQVVIDGSTAYLRLPVLDAITGTSGWLSASADELAAAGSSLGFGDAMSGPTQMLDMLTSVAGDVEHRGPEDVRGVDTEHYSATVDLADALAAMPSQQRKQIESQLGGLDAEGTAVPVDVWIDADGLVRRFTIDVAPVTSGAAGPATTATMTVELFDYGEDIAMELPDPDEVTPFSEVMGRTGSMR